MKTTCTMMYGHVETIEERVEHLRVLREQQDRALARGNGGGYTAFICWSLQPDHTEMEGTPKTGGFEYLKTLAVARMYLDNIPNLQSSWVTQGEKVGQLALLHGANDMGSTMLEENVVSQAGANFRMTEASIRRVILDLGLTPRRRTQAYELIAEPASATA
jgi:cyclic dehypoxanthinyl futalosine synthase